MSLRLSCCLLFSNHCLFFVYVQAEEQLNFLFLIFEVAKHTAQLANQLIDLGAVRSIETCFLQFDTALQKEKTVGALRAFVAHCQGKISHHAEIGFNKLCRNSYGSSIMRYSSTVIASIAIAVVALGIKRLRARAKSRGDTVMGICKFA